MSEIYCVKCKAKTETNNEEVKETKNKRRMKQGNCLVCNSKKTQFVKKDISEKDKNESV